MKESEPRAYVYAILVDHRVRYIGKGRGSRLHTHAINARRAAAKSGIAIHRLHPLMYRNLVRAVLAGADTREQIIASSLSDAEAHLLETAMIADFHYRRTDQLWNTIDERFMDSRWLPLKWDNPENPLFRLKRPIKAPR
jgi:hypothetical protein